MIVTPMQVIPLPSPNHSQFQFQEQISIMEDQLLKVEKEK
jgi:hypothetical protein